MNLNGTQLPLTTEFAGKAAAALVQRKVVNRNRPRIMALPEVDSISPSFLLVECASTASNNIEYALMNQWAAPPQTMDALFAGMKERRTKFIAECIRANVGAGRGTSSNSNPQRQWQQLADRDGSASGH
ncbi:hypothetical protein QJS10_CPA03g00871 [Acorus calamus]|uniref:Uncharacterized protein n=1 Tax=Acorus calamus TaxID=4465 RepID=A0AAV9FAA9_ACOCL|nr:hypothetical protein QJS10_CPA03g00871 [Acorus calamus]